MLLLIITLIKYFLLIININIIKYIKTENNLLNLQDEFDSDLLLLHLKNSTFNSNILGVFSNIEIPINPLIILCEVRGDLIPLKNIFPMNPLFTVRNEILNETFGIEGNSICHHVRDCVDINNYNMNDNELLLYDNCNYNAEFITTKLGKMYLINIKPIKQNDEIFVSFGK